MNAVFHPNKQLVDVLTCAKVMAARMNMGGVNIPSAYGMPQVLRVMPAARVASTGRSGVSWRRNGPQAQGEECGSTWSARNVGSRLCQHAVLRGG
jgi:hypothetical protein